MVTGTIVDEHESPISVERLWQASICNAHNLMVKLLPHVISSIEIIERDGGVGTIKKFNITDAVKDFNHVKDHIEVMDHENHVLKYSIVEGGILGIRVNASMAGFSFTSSSDGSCLAKMNIEYESLGDTLLSEEDASKIKQGILSMAKAVDAYLLANSNAYV